MAYVERITNGNKTTVILKYGALYYYLMWFTIVLSAIAVYAGSVWYVAAGLSWVVLILLAVPMWSTIRELKRVMRGGGLKASGSKWSFSNPLRYEWEDSPKSQSL